MASHQRFISTILACLKVCIAALVENTWAEDKYRGKFQPWILHIHLLIVACSFWWKGRTACGICNYGCLVLGFPLDLCLLRLCPTKVFNREQSVCFLARLANWKNSASIKVPGSSPTFKSKFDSCGTCDERKDLQVGLSPAESHSLEELACVRHCVVVHSGSLFWDDDILSCRLHSQPPTSWWTWAPGGTQDNPLFHSADNGATYLKNSEERERAAFTFMKRSHSTILLPPQLSAFKRERLRHKQGSLPSDKNPNFGKIKKKRMLVIQSPLAAKVESERPNNRGSIHHKYV